MIPEPLVDLSRLQFAATAMYHFLFVPLTLGMVWLLVIMESVYVMTGKPAIRVLASSSRTYSEAAGLPVQVLDFYKDYNS